MGEDILWNVSAILNPGTAKFATVVLNQPILTDPYIIKSLWNAAILRVTVDGGTNQWLKFLKSNNAEELPLPDFITGDFDSISEESKLYFTTKCVKFIRTPDQDETDFTKSLREIGSLLRDRNLKLDHVLVLVTNSGRVDQIMANMETLLTAKNIIGDTPLILMSSNSLTWLLASEKNHTIQVPQEFVNEKFSVGLIPLRGATRVTTSGLKWDIDNGRLAFGELVSTSNTFSEKTVKVKSGVDLIWTVQYACEEINPLFNLCVKLKSRVTLVCIMGVESRENCGLRKQNAETAEQLHSIKVVPQLTLQNLIC